MSQDVLSKNEIYSAMEANTPYSSYIKTILGQVAVTVWDSTLEKPVDIILNGNPKKKDPGCIVNVWNVKEDAVFKRLNVRLFKKGIIIPYELPVAAPEEKSVEQSTDEELKAIVNSKYMALVAKLNKIESVPVLFRMKGLAEEMDKSAKITEAIEKRISEIQMAEYQKLQPKTETQDEE